MISTSFFHIFTFMELILTILREYVCLPMNPGFNPLLLSHQENFLDNEVWRQNWCEFVLVDIFSFHNFFPSGGDEEVEIRLEETSYGSRPNTDEEERTNLSGTTAATNNQRAATNLHHQRQTTGQSRSNNAVRPPPSAPQYGNSIPTTERAVGESIQVALQPSSRLESSGTTSSRPTANNAGIQNYALSWRLHSSIPVYSFSLFSSSNCPRSLNISSSWITIVKVPLVSKWVSGHRTILNSQTNWGC